MPGVIHGDAIAGGTLRLGRVQCLASIGDGQNADALRLIFKQALSADPPAGPIDIDLDLREAAPAARWPTVAADALTVSDAGAVLAIATEAVTLTLDRSTTPMRLVIRTRRRDLNDDAFRVHLSIAFHRVLLALGMVYLHAAAVSIDGRTCMFVGEKGAGKSTLSVGLARCGATVLADDHVLLERAAPRYLVSGCEVLSRIAADTEAYVFETPLALAAQDFAGTMKKEFVLADHFSAKAHVAMPVAAIYFPYVGATLRVTPLPARQTAMDLLERTRRSFRPQSAVEVGTLLDFWVGLAASAPGFVLELEPDLRAIARLPGLLRA